MTYDDLLSNTKYAIIFKKEKTSLQPNLLYAFVVTLLPVNH